MNSRIYILAIALMTGVGAMAQNTQQNSNVEKIEKDTVQTNLFGDNLFVGANIGAQMYVGVHIPADTRSAFPVISVQSPVSIQCCWQS